MKLLTKRNVFRCMVIFLLSLSVITAGGLIAGSENEAEEAVITVSERVLIPGGQSVGIRMDVKGVLVVGLEEIETSEGIVSPGYVSGLQIGDMILSIDGTPVYYAGDVQRIVNERKDSLELSVLRKDETLRFRVKPVKCLSDDSYKLGIWVKERIAGIGTLTFYDPQTNVYAALGHGIYESQTNTLLEAGKGDLLRTEVKSIREGEVGKPGEIRGIFYGDEEPMGSVISNCQYGVYSSGTQYKEIENIQPMVMARQDQIEKGPAVILTTIEGNKVETFDITIDKINSQKAAGSKGLEISVTDERLLSHCGGIVQGMSGSPIIQNNRIVGAVTHVFVNNPTRGYGIFAEWMVEEGEKTSD